METVSVSLTEVMNARESRAQKIKQLIGYGASTVVCFTMNMIGDIKATPLSRRAFLMLSDELKNAMNAISCSLNIASTGDEAYFVVPIEPEQTKSIACRFENKEFAGRLLDIDVFNNDAEKLSRDTKRLCLICDRPAMECARSRAHGVDSVRNEANHRFKMFFSKIISSIAYEALLAEVDTTPKPGLVDRLNCGAHSDMDIDLFYRSAASLRRYFFDIAYTAMTNEYGSLSELARHLQKLGIKAERDMLNVTRGINTHKGAIYTIGLLSAAAALLISEGRLLDDTIFMAAELAKSLEPVSIENDSHGQTVLRLYGKQGARGEAICGFPTVRLAVDVLNDYANCGLDENTSAVLTLIEAISVLDDTNALYRGGEMGLNYMQTYAKHILTLPIEERMLSVLEMDKRLIERNISPGGCADVLAAAIFLRKLMHTIPKTI